MKTVIYKENPAAAAAHIRAGELVAVPTETVYGLAADGLNAAAVEQLYAVKNRPAVKPLSLMVPGPEALETYGEDVPPGAYLLAEKFWPGPLTLVLKAKSLIPPVVLAGGATVGLRCPAQEQTLALLRACGRPLAAPSANPSGAPSAKTAAEVLAYFNGKISAVIDGGPCALGTESTLADLTGERIRILRAGALSEEELLRPLCDSLCLVGLTGGTGTGKTTAARAAAALGALCIDADAVYHELCQTEAAMLSEIEGRFPGVVEEGVLQRKKLGSLVFRDAEALAELSRITEYYISREVDRRLAAHALRGGKYAVIDAIDILDTPLEKRLAAVVGVTAPKQTRVERVAARDGLSPEYARLRVEAQPPDEFYEKRCAVCLRNDGAQEAFYTLAAQTFQKLFNINEET